MRMIQANQYSDRIANSEHALLASVTVVIPALNEEKSLPLVLGDLPVVGRVIW